MPMNRREFVGWMSMGAIVTSVIGCNDNIGESSQQSTQQNQESSGEFQVVGTVDELDEQGSLLDEMTGVMVFRNPSNDLIAVNPTCTHKSCTVELAEDGERLACPCHGSQFTIRGEVLQGPAKEPLTNYEVKTEDDKVLVKLS